MLSLTMIMEANLFGIIVFTITIINLIILIYVIHQSNNREKNFNEYLKKLGNGENLNDILKGYIEKVDEVHVEEEKIKSKFAEVEKNIEKCIQKVGMVRYSAYNNQGSDLCFAVAFLDFEDNGVVINGIYSRDNTTSTYAKPISNGKSKYTLTKEEQEAIDIAKNNGYKYYMKVEQSKV